MPAITGRIFEPELGRIARGYTISVRESPFSFPPAPSPEAIKRVLRKSRFDDGSPLVQFFRLDLSGEWAAFIEASKELAELVIDGKPDGTGFGTDEETERLESLRKPFLSLLAKAQEES